MCYNDYMTANRIRYAVVGLGRAGWDIHIHQLRNRPDAQIVAVVDSVAERRKQAADEFGCKTYATLAPLLKQSDVDVVIIATPSVQHAPQTIQSLKARKHVVVEKPMAMSVNQAHRMVAAAKLAGRKLFVHQNYRLSPLSAHLQDIVQSGLLGSLYHIRVCICAFSRRNDWQTLVKYGGGVLNNTAPHYIDQLLQLMGSPAVKVMGDLRQIASAGDAEDHVKALIRTENGITADMEISNAQNVATSLPKWTLFGSNGTLTCDGKTSVLRWFDPKDSPPPEVIDGAVPNREYANSDTIPWKEKTMAAECKLNEDFYDNVRDVLRHDKPMRISPESVSEVMRVISMIRKDTSFPGRTPAMTRTKARRPLIGVS